MKQQKDFIGNLCDNPIRYGLLSVGYKCQTTFPEDFTVAERLDGVAGVKDTFNRGFDSFKDDEIFITEMYLVANWKEWQHAETNHELAMAYHKIQQEIDKYVDKNWTKEQKHYFYETAD